MIPAYPDPSHQSQQQWRCQFLSPLRTMGSRRGPVVPHPTTVNLGYGCLEPAYSSNFLSVCFPVSKVLLLLTSLFLVLVDLCLFFFKKSFSYSFSAISGGRKIRFMCSIYHLYWKPKFFLYRKSLRLLLRTVFSLSFNSYTSFPFFFSVISHRPSSAPLSVDAVAGIFVLVWFLQEWFWSASHAVFDISFW